MFEILFSSYFGLIIRAALKKFTRRLIILSLRDIIFMYNHRFLCTITDNSDQNFVQVSNYFELTRS